MATKAKRHILGKGYCRQRHWPEGARIHPEFARWSLAPSILRGAGQNCDSNHSQMPYRSLPTRNLKHSWISRHVLVSGKHGTGF